MRIRTIAASAAAAAVILGGGTAALAASGSSTAPTAKATTSRTFTGCVTKARTLAHLYGDSHSCASGQLRFTWNQVGQQGPSGVVSTHTTDLHGVASVPTGGSFVLRSTPVGTITLKAGTYLLNVNAKATPNVSSGIEVFPQFFVYNQAVNPAFAGDLFNVGSGPLASNSTTIDSYFSGSGTVTLATTTTLHFIAFGYDSDTSAGTYTLDDLSVTATQLNVR